MRLRLLSGFPYNLTMENKQELTRLLTAGLEQLPSQGADARTAAARAHWLN